MQTLVECAVHVSRLRADVARQLSSQRPQHVQLAALILERMGPAAGDQGKALWAAAMKNFGGPVGDACARALAVLGPNCVTTVAPFLLHPAWSEYAMAARVLQSSGEAAKSAVPTILELSAHKESDRRAIAANLLATFTTDPTAAKRLIEILGDPLAGVRRLAIHGLARSAMLPQPILDKLSHMAQSDPMPHIRAAAGELVDR